MSLKTATTVEEAIGYAKDFALGTGTFYNLLLEEAEYYLAVYAPEYRLEAMAHLVLAADDPEEWRRTAVPYDEGDGYEDEPVDA